MEGHASESGSASAAFDVSSAGSECGDRRSTMPRQVDGSDSLAGRSASSATCRNQRRLFVLMICVTCR